MDGVDLTPREGVTGSEPAGDKQELQPKVHRMERSSKRGKIPQKDWPSIIKRYESGETLAAIARTYDCSPPAISYILSRSRARNATADPAGQSIIEPLKQGLMDVPSSETSASVKRGETEFGETAAHVIEAHASIPVEGLDCQPPQVDLTRPSNGELETPRKRTDVVATGANGSTDQDEELPRSTDPGIEEGPPNRNLNLRAAPSQNGEPRRTLHLPVSHSSNHGPDAKRDWMRGPKLTEDAATGPARGHQPTSFIAPDRQPHGHHSATSFRTEAGEPSQAKQSGAFIDRALRERVDEDIATFLAAFDAALADDSLESRAGLRAATDRLLRAGARTRIELERLEARVPLPAQEGSRHSGSNSRPR